MTALNPVPVSQASGAQTTGSAVITVTLPAYTAGDFIVLVMSNNQAQTGFTFSAAISTANVLANAGGRVTAYQVIPNGGAQTTFTVTGSASAVWQWWIADYAPASTSLPVDGANDQIGNSTSAVITVPEVQLGYIATGNELLISASGVNSTATWTTDANTQFHTTANNAAMMVNALNMGAGHLTGVPASMNRGSGGSSRNQNSLAFVLQAAPGGTVNLLTNPSFESGTTLATDWTDEHTTQTGATYSLTASGVVDGTVAQQFAYTGVSGDGGVAKTELFQAPISASPGQYLTFAVWLSGTVTATYVDVGMEGFTAGSGFISEADTLVTVLGTAPVQYRVSYLCPPTTDHVAVYLQCPEIGATSSLTVIADSATLTAGPAPAAGAPILTFFP